MSAKIYDLISEKLSGEWGSEPTPDRSVNILRTTNFTNEGKLKLTKIATRNIDDKKIAKKKLQAGDTIIEKSGGSPKQPVGRVVYFDIEEGTYLCNNFTSVLRPNEKVLPKYFFYGMFYLHLTNKTLRYQNKTTGIINLQLDRYLNTEYISLPDKKEQKEVIELLDRADTLIQNRRSTIKLIDEYLLSVFLEMFGDIKAKKSPHEWGNIRQFVKAGSGKSSKGVVSETKTEFPIYGGNGINGWAREPLYDEPVVIAGRVGQQCGVIHVSRGASWVTDNAIVLKITDTSKLNPIYLADALRHSALRQTVQHLDLPFINQGIILDRNIPLPGITLQDEYAEIVKAVEDTKSAMVAQLNEFDKQFMSIMQTAFKT